MASSSTTADIQSLERILERSPTIRDKTDAFRSFLNDQIKNDNDTHTLTLFPGCRDEFNPLADEQRMRDLDSLAEKHGLKDVYVDWAMENVPMGLDSKPLLRLPCANFDGTKNWKCDKDGTMACGGCKLVSYCSKVSGISGYMFDNR